MIDLETGELLTGAGARRCLVSRCLPDPYDPDATHEAVDKLLSHLGDSERDWLLSAFGHALRGQPNRRNYLLVGEGGGGKTTLMTAVGKALGDHAGFIAAGAISARKYAGGPEPELEAFTNRRADVLFRAAAQLGPPAVEESVWRRRGDLPPDVRG